MGILGTGFKIVGGVAKGTAAASRRTSNAIYNGMQNSKARKEIRNVNRLAEDSNYQNRGVAVMPGINKQQLLLISADPRDNDVLDYSANSPTAALDYIWGVSDEPGNVIVSGGSDQDRAVALMPFIHKLQEKGIAVFALHTGNRALEKAVDEHSVDFEAISRNSCYGDIFRGIPAEDIAFLLYESMDDNSSFPAAESLLKALVEILLITEGDVTFQNLSSFSLYGLKDKLEAIRNSGMIDSNSYKNIQYDYMAGASETDKVRVFLSKLAKQSQSAWGTPGINKSNIKRILKNQGSVTIDVGMAGHDVLISFLVNYLSWLRGQGKQFAILLDGMSTARIKNLEPLFTGGYYAISHQDVYTSLQGGETRAEDYFIEVTGLLDSLILFRHISGASCQKWSEYLGMYRKTKVRNTLSQNTAYREYSNSNSVSVEEVDEARIRPETIGRLPDGCACINTSEGILIAAVQAP